MLRSAGAARTPTPVTTRSAHFAKKTVRGGPRPSSASAHHPRAASRVDHRDDRRPEVSGQREQALRRGPRSRRANPARPRSGNRWVAGRGQTGRRPAPAGRPDESRRSASPPGAPSPTPAREGRNGSARLRPLSRGAGRARSQTHPPHRGRHHQGPTARQPCPASPPIRRRSPGIRSTAPTPTAGS